MGAQEVLQPTPALAETGGDIVHSEKSSGHFTRTSQYRCDWSAKNPDKAPSSPSCRANGIILLHELSHGASHHAALRSRDEAIALAGTTIRSMIAHLDAG
jgi:hypothetical protein